MFEGMFKSKEVKRTLRALELVQQHSSNSSFALIKPDVYKMVVQANKMLDGLVNDKLLSYETIVYVFVTNSLKDHLCSGSYHTYRGVMSAQGQRLLELWDYAVEQLLENGFCDAAAADRNKQWVRAEISKVG